MDWAFIIDCALKALGSLAATLVITLATILFTKLRNKIKDGRINQYAVQVVQAAEQLYPNMGRKTGPEKYKYVAERLTAKFPSLKDNEYLKSIIEGAVYTVSEQIKQISKNKRENKKQEKLNKVETTEINNNSLVSF